MVAFELDNTELLQHFLNKDIPKLEREITQKKYQQLELDRVVDIVDYYILPNTQTPSLPYSTKELVYLRKLYQFAVTSEMRLHEDSILREELSEDTNFPAPVINLILSYTNDFGVGKYEYGKNNSKEYVVDPKVVAFRNAELKLLSDEDKINEMQKSKKEKVRV